MIALLLTALLVTDDGWADDRTPIQTVYPVYPEAAEFYGFTALCHVRFDIDAAGVPENVCAACNTGARGVDNQAIINTIAGQFVQNAEASIAQRRYAPEHWGARGARTEIRFLMYGDDESDLPPPPPTEECQGTPIT